MFKFCALLLPLLAGYVHADSLPREAGRALGEFSMGASESITKPMFDSIKDGSPHWVTVQPRTKAECLKESNGELNPVYVRCFNGMQQLVTTDSKGNQHVLQERKIPMNIP
jgi:hypothetical protein